MHFFLSLPFLSLITFAIKKWVICYPVQVTEAVWNKIESYCRFHAGGGRSDKVHSPALCFLYNMFFIVCEGIVWFVRRKALQPGKDMPGLAQGSCLMPRPGQDNQAPLLVVSWRRFNSITGYAEEQLAYCVHSRILCTPALCHVSGLSEVYCRLHMGPDCVWEMVLYFCLYVAH